MCDELTLYDLIHSFAAKMIACYKTDNKSMRCDLIGRVALFMNDDLSMHTNHAYYHDYFPRLMNNFMHYL